MRARRLLLLASALGALLGVLAVGFGIEARVPKSHDFEASHDPMLSIPAGTASIADAGGPVAGFEIDALEVSVADYAVCVRAGACKLYTTATDPRDRIEDRNADSAACRGGRYDRGTEAMNCVDWIDADAYCKWAGKRLPAREEWALAIAAKHPEKGPELHRASPERGWFAGEWTSTPAATDNGGPWPELRRIGAWRTELSNPTRLWTTYYDWYPVSVRSPWVGFRCARGGR